MVAPSLEKTPLEAKYQVGQKVAVDIGGSAGNRAEGVIVAVKRRPELITYEVRFPLYGDGTGIESFYMAEYLTPLG
ncbi:MAG: hypothetical protein K0Q72_3054 [Armatimonadetes bacterium]|jgi:hypothetical protein|nr:hypothetical protein [Armatimonadota bacterium]